MTGWARMYAVWSALMALMFLVNEGRDGQDILMLTLIPAAVIGTVCCPS
jgi:hypothetical protein